MDEEHSTQTVVQAIEAEAPQSQVVQCMENQYSPKVSVVITCFNYGKYIEEAIGSVLNSTFKDVEIIVVDDGSTDLLTRHVLNWLNNSKTTVIRQSNKGAAAARNTGIRHARGEYIYSLDSDDKIHPKLLEKAVAVLDKRPKVGFVSSWLRRFGKTRSVLRYPSYNFYTLLFRNIIVSGSMFRKSAWKQVGGYNQKMRGFEDWEFWISLGAKGWLGYIIPKPMFLYRKHHDSKLNRSLKMRNKLIKQIRKKHAHLYTKRTLTKLKRIWKPRKLIKRKKRPALRKRARQLRPVPVRRISIRKRRKRLK